jgi:hypothetical protein
LREITVYVMIKEYSVLREQARVNIANLTSPMFTMQQGATLSQEQVAILLALASEAAEPGGCRVRISLESFEAQSTETSSDESNPKPEEPAP